MKAKKGLLIGGVLLALLLSASVSAREMAHWAIVRNAGGEVIGTLDEGDEVQVLGIWKDSPARSVVYIPAWDVTGTVAAVYIYGGTDYEYENPNEYVRPNSVSASDTQPDAAQDSEEESYEEEDAYSEESYEEESYEEDSYDEDGSGDAYLQEFYKEEEEWAQNNAEPEYYNDDIWVDVDIDAQVITLNNGDSIILSAPCVTGTLGAADTPTGEFPILSKTTTANLSGFNLNGEAYSRDVQYWIMLTEYGVGIHDAPWRDGVFGGDIYMTDGSMGCINVEPYVAATIYDYVHEGTMVYIH